MDRHRWTNECALRLAQLGVPGHSESACTLADEQHEKYGASSLAWEKPVDAAERLAAEDPE